MRLRKPIQALPEECKNISPTESFKKTFQVELITPLYGGGVEAGVPDEKMPIRATAIRGQLHFWWRLLNREKKFEDERKIWGGVSDGEATASQVIINVKKLRKIQREPCAKYQKKNNGGFHIEFLYGSTSGYVLFPGQGKTDRYRVTEQPHDILLPGLTFTLEIRVTELKDDKTAQDIWEQEVLQPLRWWASFGGLGARTRRGLGSVKITGLTSVDKSEVDKVKGCQLVTLKPESDATDAWTKAVGKLKDFRQGVDIGRNPGTQDNRPGRSRWPEADSIRKITECYLPKHKTPVAPKAAIPSFPRAAFGLPIITHFKDGSKDCRTRNLEPADTTLYPFIKGEKNEGEKKDRMASPLILKAMWTGKDYQLIALLLPHNNNNMQLLLEGSNEPPIDDWWSNKHSKAMTGAADNPLSGRTGDVLKDFLAFFQEK